MGSKSFNPG